MNLGYDETAAHLKMECVAEPGAIEPVYTDLVGCEGRRNSFIRRDTEVDVVMRQTEAVRQVLDLVKICLHDRHLIALLHPDLIESVRRSNTGHEDGDLVALTNDLVRHLQLDTVFGGEFAFEIKLRITAVPTLLRLEWLQRCDDGVMRFRMRRRIVDDPHFFTRDVDQLLILRMHGTHIQKAVLGELVQRD